jgi:hypothetical protein
MSPAELVVRWREDAEILARNRAEHVAAVCRDHADALEMALRDAGGELLTLSQGARESGYSPDRLRHLIAEGTIPNAGRKGSPRIRRADLPRKPAGGAPGAFDASAVARRLTSRSEAA